MAELKVTIKGDAKGAKAAAAEVQKAMADASKAMIADAKAADAAILASRRDEAKQSAALAKQKLRDAQDAAKAATDAEKAESQARVALAKQEAQAKIAASRQAANAAKEAAREAQQAAKDAVRDARNAASSGNWSRQGGGDPAWAREARRMQQLGRGSPGGPSADTGDISGMLKLELLTRAIGMVSRFAEALDALGAKLADASLSAEGKGAARTDALRFAGFDPAAAGRIAAAASAAVTSNRMSSASVQSGLDALKGATRRPSEQIVTEIINRADRVSVAGAMSLAGEGFNGADATDLSARFAQASGGSPMTQDLARLAARMRSSKALDTTGKMAAFLAASSAVGAPQLPDQAAAIAAAQQQVSSAGMDASGRRQDLSKAESALSYLRLAAESPMGGAELKRNQEEQLKAREDVTRAKEALAEAERRRGDAQGMLDKARAQRPEDMPFLNQSPELYQQYAARLDRAGKGLRLMQPRLAAAKGAAEEQTDRMLRSDTSEAELAIEGQELKRRKSLGTTQAGGAGVNIQAGAAAVGLDGAFDTLNAARGPIDVRVAAPSTY